MSFDGGAHVQDPESGKREEIKFAGNVELLKVGFEIVKDEPHPQIKISNTEFILKKDAFAVSMFGELPLY